MPARSRFPRLKQALDSAQQSLDALDPRRDDLDRRGPKLEALANAIKETAAARKAENHADDLLTWEAPPSLAGAASAALQLLQMSEDANQKWVHQVVSKYWHRPDAWDAVREHFKGFALRLLGADKAARSPKRKRRRASVLRVVPLTEKQCEAAYLVGEHKGNISAAARAAGRKRQAMEKSYKTAMKKLGMRIVKPKTQPLPSDRRGQADVATSASEAE
jgi:hypothetical protein